MRVSSARPFLRGAWVLAILVAITGSLLPANTPEMRAVAALDVNDKALHFAVYAILALLPAWSEARRNALRAWALLLGMGILLEILQLFSSGRSCDFGDALADMAGLCIGFAAGTLLSAAVSPRPEADRG
jgi:VanZ family protein